MIYSYIIGLLSMIFFCGMISAIFGAEEIDTDDRFIIITVCIFWPAFVPVGLAIVGIAGVIWGVLTLGRTISTRIRKTQ